MQPAKFPAPWGTGTRRPFPPASNGTVHEGAANGEAPRDWPAKTSGPSGRRAANFRASLYSERAGVAHEDVHLCEVVIVPILIRVDDRCRRQTHECRAANWHGCGAGKCCR